MWVRLSSTRWTSVVGALVVMSTAPAGAAARQAGQIVGTVVDEATDAPVAHASVFLHGTGRSALSNGEGRFVFVGVAPGSWTVVAERLGYATERRDVEVAAGQASAVTLALSSDAISIPRVVVTATREARVLDEIAAAVGIVGRRRLEETRPSHPTEIMGKVPGVWVNVTGGEGHMTAIRQPLGTSPLYLYLEDGVPTRSPGFFNHNALYEINLPQADRIEVMKGPANALYGSDAIGGVVNVQTRAPSGGRTAEASVEVGEFGFNRVLASVSNRWGADGIRVDANVTRTDGWRQGTAYDRYTGTFRWDHQSGATSVKTVVAYSNIDQSTAGSSAISEEDFRDRPTVNYTPISFREVTALRVSTALDRRTSWGALGLTAFARSNSMDILPNWSLTFDPAVWETENVSFGLLAKARRSLPDVDGQIVAGVDLDLSPGEHRERSISPTREGKVFTSFSDGSPLYDYDVTYRQASPYVHAELALSDRLRVTGGLRADLMGYEYSNHLTATQEGRHRRPADTDRTFAAVTPKLGVTFRLTGALNLFAAYREGFRAPSEGQLFRQGSAESTVDLDPVRSASVEGGVRGSLGQRVRFDVAAYRMEVTDDILGFVLEDGRRENQNAGETLHRGVEVGVGVLLARGFQLDVAGSWQKHTYEVWRPNAATDFGGNEMLTAPQTIANAELSWAPSFAPGLHLAAEWSHLGSYWLDQTNENAYDGHDLLGARASFRLASVTLFLRANNLTDERYAERASFNSRRGTELAPGLPRTLYFGVQLR